MTLVTVVIPIFNEAHILPKLLMELKQLQPQLFVTSFLIVDDGSKDGTANILSSQTEIPHIVLPQNLGKGGAVKAGISCAKSTFVGVYDGDLEYDPEIICKLDSYANLHQKPSYAIFASRYSGKSFYAQLRDSNQKLSSILMNHILVFMYRILYKTILTDPLTGVKLYPRDFVGSLELTRNKFDGDHEIAIDLIKSKFEIVEIPVKYSPRGKAEGKKIGAIDAFMAVRTLMLGRLNS